MKICLPKPRAISKTLVATGIQRVFATCTQEGTAAPVKPGELADVFRAVLIRHLKA